MTLVLLGAAVVVGLSALAVRIFNQPDTDLTTTGFPTSTPTTSWSASTPTWSPSPSATPTWSSAAPTNSPTATPSTTVTPPRRTPAGPSDSDVIGKNRIYSVGAQASVSCRESNARPSDKNGTRIYYQRLKECLDRAWPGQVRKAGGEFRPPTVLMISGSVETPCGQYVRAFYCGKTETIYMRWEDDVRQYTKFPERFQKVYARMFTSFQFSHEYGHHVQQLTGILGSYWNLRYAASESKALEYSRRAELQASCFASVFMGANQPSYPITGEARSQWMWLVDHYGDEYGEGVRDHGSRKNHGYWARRGFRSESPSTCNTFTAPSSRVS
ncbi:neutral zinc metallopeptidase [Actinopolymorpha alba]|uniref:neutral zinc metallopeptidase n=1 Tax=Actinopolymorpha alba TaxID=533267 RepID=UPI000372272A|nr:neutral zinc metallopeptidase [Actinopolymorpha alba]